MTTIPTTTLALATASNDDIQRELLARALAEAQVNITRVGAELAALRAKQRRRMDEMHRLCLRMAARKQGGAS